MASPNLTPTPLSLAPGTPSAGAPPRTPEPMTRDDDDAQARPPSPPRPRLKLKRRNVSTPFSAPTQDFLASVAAADIPIPSIEEPEIATNDPAMPASPALMVKPDHPSASDDEDSLLSLPVPRIAIPKTPVPEDVPSLSPRRYPNWSAASTFSSSTEDSSPEPDYASSRPSTSRSTHTNSSLFSRLSHFSDDQCISPDGDSKLAQDESVFLRPPKADESGRAASTKHRRAPWTKAMSTHLWNTYMLYLQDPVVTPFRSGRSCIPPPGVCDRVAREAKRSWKGSKVAKQATVTPSAKSRSTTPTAEASSVYIEWPHTCAATKTHLKELCKLKAATPAVGLRYLSRSPTPFAHAATRHWNRRATPSRMCFGTKDMAVSLSVSTCEAMQPHGPLAQLTSSIETLEPTPCDSEPTAVVPDFAPADSVPATQAAPFEATSERPRGRLGSPFVPKSYGPSSSSMSLSAALSSEDARMPHTVGPKRLQSPPRINRTSTARRRSMIGNKPPRDLRHTRKRPSLSTDFWTEPASQNGIAASHHSDILSPPMRGSKFLETALASWRPSGAAAAEYSSTSSSVRDELFIPRTSGSLGSSLRAQGSQPPQPPRLVTSTTAPELSKVAPAEAPRAAPPRLGSPFAMGPSSTSFSFPNRLFPMASMQDAAAEGPAGGVHRPFRTVQQQSASGAARPLLPRQLDALADATKDAADLSAANDLARRLAYVDERLKEHRDRDGDTPRSDPSC